MAAKRKTTKTAYPKSAKKSSYPSTSSKLCATPGCKDKAVDGSKYCAPHKKIAAQVMKEIFAKGKEEREDRYKKFGVVYELAMSKAREAAKAVTPTPMVVQQHESVLDDNSPVQQEWVVSEGVCGIGWVWFPKGNTSFASWLKSNKHASRDNYRGGVTVHFNWMHSQSYERYAAACRAFCKVIHENLPDVKCYSQVRED